MPKLWVIIFCIAQKISSHKCEFIFFKCVELKTPNARLYQYRPFRNGIMYFDVKAEHDAHIALTGEPNESHPIGNFFYFNAIFFHSFYFTIYYYYKIVEIILGGWGNTKSAIRFNHTRPDVIDLDTPDILNPLMYQRFYVSATPDGVSIMFSRPFFYGLILWWFFSAYRGWTWRRSSFPQMAKFAAVPRKSFHRLISFNYNCEWHLWIPMRKQE